MNINGEAGSPKRHPGEQNPSRKPKSYCIKLDPGAGDFDLLLAATDGGAFEGRRHMSGCGRRERRGRERESEIKTPGFQVV